GEIEIPGGAVGALIKALLARTQHLFDQRRDRLPFLHPRFHSFFHTDRITQLEYAALPVETPLHRAIDGNDVVRDFRDAAGRVVKSIAENPAIELTGAIGRMHQRSDTTPRVVDVASHLHGGEVWLLPRPILERLKIEREDLTLRFLTRVPAATLHCTVIHTAAFFGVTALGNGYRVRARCDLLVKPLTGLFTQEPTFHHPHHEGGRVKQLAAFVIGKGFPQIADHMKHHIEADQIERAEA